MREAKRQENEEAETVVALTSLSALSVTDDSSKYVDMSILLLVVLA